MKVAVAEIRYHVRKVMIGLIAIDITMAITKRVTDNRFLKSNRSNNHPVVYPGAINISKKSRKAKIELYKSCKVKLTIVPHCQYRLGGCGLKQEKPHDE